ncbi:PilW family protein [Massilia aquatica]|uniref:Prepilin-type N-terminal cleavage/methylation domain-containing protein n=1 Tax=Massilia aquatica TaxID=2609000 RepID=A0ABX0M7L0_9BURK|nr:PilW family protein [Massilia aquatica]NHZ42942.1 prepilin-type N-terminal cleavage/methylation domain-containing protein [Massilia aquatica]
MSGPISSSPYRAPRSGADGFGLIEVLVAMTLGLVLLGGVGYVFMGSKDMSVAQSDGVRMNESARNATDVMGRALRQAGYKLNVDAPLEPDPLSGANNDGDVSDVLIVRHDPSWTSTSKDTGVRTGKEANCEGKTVDSDNPNDSGTGAPGANVAQVVYQFRVVGTQLKCFATDKMDVDTSSGVVVAENIENMQISYGIGTGAEVIDKYIPAPDAAQYLQVSAVRVSLLVRGPSTRGVVGAPQSLDFNGAKVEIADGRLRNVVTTTFMVRNQTRWNQ